MLPGTYEGGSCFYFLKTSAVGDKEKQYQQETTTYLNFKPQNHHKQDGVILMWEK